MHTAERLLGVANHSACPYQVWAFGRLSVFASIRWMVNSRGPAAPVEPYKTTV